MVPSNGMCIGVTPSGVAGSTRPSMRSATAWAMALAASVSVPAGRWGPCCSTLPAGRITSGLFLSCAAISGWVNSGKVRLGNMAVPFGEEAVRVRDHVGDGHRLTVLLDRAQRGVDHRHRDIAVPGAELVRSAGAAALREHVELGAEHVALGDGQLLAPAIAVLAALDIERRGLVQLFRRIPGAEVDLVVHEALRSEHPHGENPRRGP